MTRHQLIQTYSDFDCFRSKVVGAQARVPVLGGGHCDYINFDNAASTPTLKPVLETVNAFMEWYSSVHRGSGFKSRLSTKAYDDAREIVRDFVGANAAEHTVVFGKNTTEAINKISYRLDLNAADIVLVSKQEHHSNDLPWRAHANVRHIDLDNCGRIDINHLDALLDEFGARVKLVAVTAASNVTGFVSDFREIARMAHRVGARILVDCAQFAPHRPIQMGRLDDPEHLDYLVFSAHKMYAPFGTGVLVSRRDTLETGEPEYKGGGTIKAVTINDVHWAEGPDRDEAGSPNVVGAIALAAAIKELQEFGFERIVRHEAQLMEYALAQLSSVPGIEIFGGAEADRDRLGVIAFNMEGLQHALVAAILSSEFGIGVRSGCFCAHPYVTHLLGFDTKQVEQVSARISQGNFDGAPGMIRVSFGAYNTMTEIDELVLALRLIAAGGYAGNYTLNSRSGEFCPDFYAPDMKKYFSLS
jgi:selenocysteine lyase/cysteine desulfurase